MLLFFNEKFPNLSRAVQYFKDNEKGVSEVCTLVEDFAKERVEQEVKAERIDIARTLIEMNMTNENISIATHLTAEEVEKLRNCK